jgi:hypothetical protein
VIRPAPRRQEPQEPAQPRRTSQIRRGGRGGRITAAPESSPGGESRADPAPHLRDAVPARKESEVLAEVLRYLRSRPDVVAWRVNTGAMVGEYKGKRRFVRFGEPGQSDIQGYLTAEPWPRPFFLEVKRPGGKLTPAQLQFLVQRRADGCLAGAAWSADDAGWVLGAGQWIREPLTKPR